MHRNALKTLEPARLAAESQLQAFKNLGTRTPASRITASGFKKPWNPHACQQNHSSRLSKTLEPARLSAKITMLPTKNLGTRTPVHRIGPKTLEPARLPAESQLQPLKNLGTRTPASRITAPSLKILGTRTPVSKNHHAANQNP